MLVETGQVRVEATVGATVASLWRAWTTSQGAETFFAERANIDLRVGGPYEIFFNQADERMSTKGRKVLSYEPERMVSFEWNLPLDEFPELKNSLTWVVVDFTPLDASHTRVTVTQLGLKAGRVWERAARHMQQGWSELAERLKARFDSGPIDWAHQKMMWQARVNTVARSKGAAGQ